MDTKVKLNEIPIRADRLYIKLYCERKGTTSRKIKQKARKLWMSLSPSEKKYFSATTSKRNQLNVANSLGTTKTYLKEKITNKSSRQPVTTSQEPEIDVEPYNKSLLIESESDSITQDNFEECITNHVNLNSNHNTTIEDSVQEIPLSQAIQQNAIDATRVDDIVNVGNNPETVQECTNIATPLLEEPSPPNVIKGQDLYNMIKDHDAPDWNQLDKLEKRYHNTAVRKIKLDYIKKYRIYLESLSKYDLYRHYMKKLH